MKKLLSIYLTVMFIFTVSPLNGAYVKAADGFVMDGEISGEINVHYCYEMYGDNLQDAVLRFEQKYPGTKVNLRLFSIYGNNVPLSAENDYISQCNVEMMSGGGADIFAIDVLPYYKYADNGQFVDLRGFIDADPDFDWDDYHKSVFDAAMYRGGQYILPVEFDFNIIRYNKNLMDEAVSAQFDSYGKYTYSQLIEIGIDSFQKRNNEESQIQIMNARADNWFNYELNNNFNIFADVENKKANFADGSFAELLNNAKEYGKKGYIGSAEFVETGNMSDLISFMSAMLPTIYNDIDAAMFLHQMIAVDPNSVRMAIGISADDEIIGLHANINGDVPVNITRGYAMNANSKNKKTAWEFMKFLINEDVQISNLYGGIPVNRKVFVKSVETVIYNSYIVGSYDAKPMPADAVLSQDQQILMEKYLEYIEAFLPMLDTHRVNDRIIDTMIDTETDKFFKGLRTAGEVANILQSRVEIYLQE